MDAILATLLATFPLLRDKRVEDVVFGDIGEISVDLLAIGGTWTRYDDWEVSLIPPDPVHLYSHLEQLLRQRGYTIGTISDDLATWERLKSGSFTYLKCPDKDGKINFRIQPES